MKILVINAGSSSLKYQFYNTATGEILAKGICERIGAGGKVKHTAPGKDAYEAAVTMHTHADAIRTVMKLLTEGDTAVVTDIREIEAVGHRVLHGGAEFACSVLVDEKVIAAIKRCIPLGPLHNPANLTGIMACKEVMGDVPQVAVFDTAFHQTMPEKAYLYALPYEYYEKYQVRRYGFHGTSHLYVSRKAAEFLKRPAEELKIITCHLGNGSSIAAVDGGKCVDTSMGLTPLEGLPMGTRCGSIDPAIVEFIMDKEHKDIREMNDIMNKKSGVLGMTGLSSDFRDLYKAKGEGNRRAATALDVFIYAVKKYIGAYAAAMGGLDAVVFTAGIGENTPALRISVLEGLEFLGIEVDHEKNNARATDFSGPNARVRALMIPTDEEYVIASDTEMLVGGMK